MQLFYNYISKCDDSCCCSFIWREVSMGQDVFAEEQMKPHCSHDHSRMFMLQHSTAEQLSNCVKCFESILMRRYSFLPTGFGKSLICQVFSNVHQHLTSASYNVLCGCRNIDLREKFQQHH